MSEARISVRSGRVRAVLLCLAPLGLAYLCARLSPARSTPVTVGVQFAAYAGALTVLARATSHPSWWPSRRERAHVARCVAVLAGGATGIALLPPPCAPLGLTLVGAASEEFIFRRDLPDALTTVLRPGAPRWADPVGVLLAQALFAACHVATAIATGVDPGGPAAVARLTAAGMGLAAAYRGSGTILAPVGIHVLINEARAAV